MQSATHENGHGKQAVETDVLLKRLRSDSLHDDSKAADDVSPGKAEDGGRERTRLPTNYLETLIHYVKANFGAGMFALGEAIKHAGIILGPLLLAFISILCVFAQHQLLRASALAAERLHLHVHPDYAETMQYGTEMGPFPRWAKTARRAVCASLIITQLGFCSVYFVFVASNAKQVLDQYILPVDVHLYMAICLLPILLGGWVRTLKFLVPISVAANFFLFSGLFLTVYLCLRDGLPDVADRTLVGELRQLPLFFGTAVYCFEAIAMTMPLRNEMRRPDNFSRPLGVLNVGSTFITMVFILIGVISYVKFGDDIRSIVLLNFDEADVVCQVAKIVVCIAILLSYPIQLYIFVDLVWPWIQKRYGLYKHPSAYEIAFRSGAVLFTFLLAESIPRLGLFMSLLGSVSSTFLALIAPPLLDWSTRWRQGLPVWRHLINALLLAMGLFGCGWGSYSSTAEIIAAFSNSNMTVT